MDAKKRWKAALLCSLCVASGRAASKAEGTARNAAGTASEACPAGVEVRWMKPTRSSVYATPLITPFLSEDGEKSIVVPSFHRYLEVMRGSTGEEVPGWPAEHPSDVHAAPLLHDVDHDGALDVLLATYDGHVLFYKDNGELMKRRSFRLPSLQVKEGWYVGLKPDHVNHDDPDVGLRDTHTGDAGAALLSEEDILKSTREEASGERNVQGRGGTADKAGRKTLQVEDQVERGQHQLSEEAAGSFDVFDEADGNGDEAEGGAVGEIHEDEDGMFEGWEDDEAYDEEEDYDVYDDDERRWDRHAGEDELDELWDEDWWDDFSAVLEDGQVKVDPHVLCTPALGDLDGDGRTDLVVALSHFFDRERYDDPAHAWRLNGVQASKYVASSLVAYDLTNRTIKWHQHLDLSTDETFYRAYAFAAPTLVDVDDDGKLEVVLGTSMGFLYVLNADGTNRAGWPKQMGEIQGQVTAADVDTDGHVELLVADRRGNVVAFRGRTGDRLWERHVNGMVSQEVTVADVDGDGALEVVLGTSTGHIHVLRGVDGRPVAPFPFRTRGRIASPVLPVKLLDSRPSLHLVVLAFDGILYMVDGATGCADVRELGETSYTMVLADDLDDDGRMDLVVTTMNGNVYLLDTSSPSHPLKATSAVPYVHRHQWYGVHVREEGRRMQEANTRRLRVRYRIVDARPAPRGNASGSDRSPYRVRATLHARCTSCVDPHPAWTSYTDVSLARAPGWHGLTLSVPSQPSAGRVVVSVTDAFRCTTSASATFAFHLRPVRLLKWLYASPALLLFVGWIRRRPSSALP
uniref:DEX1 C-terminal domain-containing protein n=1 Tax=Picocystis salinarum TaxID=88271 RepID=A0A7S3XE24_9CHLO